MYSHYKTHMTWKALVGVTPNGVVSFISDLWAGSISDKQLVIKSGMLDLCEQGDAIMGDKGFLISDLTTPRGLQLIIPPKKKQVKQMSVVDLVMTRRIANVRIHVERHMERVKNYRILNSLTGTMKANVS
jgi:ribosomal protein S15P/S13E